MLYRRSSERIRIRQRFNEAMKKLETAIAASYWANKRKLANNNRTVNSSRGRKANASFPFKRPVTNNSNIQRRNVNVPFSGISFRNNNQINAGRKVVSLCIDRQVINSTVNRKNMSTSFTGDTRRTDRNNFRGRTSPAVPFPRNVYTTVDKGVNSGKVSVPFSGSNHLKNRVVATTVNTRKLEPFSYRKCVTKNNRPTCGISGSDRKVKNKNSKIKERKGKLNITGKSVEVKFLNLSLPGQGFPNQLNQMLHENIAGEEGTAIDLKGILYLEPHAMMTVDDKSYGIEIRNESMSIIYDKDEEKRADKAKDETPSRFESSGKKERKHGVKRMKNRTHSKKIRSKKLKSLRCHGRKRSDKKKAIHKKISKKSYSRHKSSKGNRQSKDKTRKKAGLKRKRKSGEKIKKSSHKVKGARKVVHKQLTAKSKENPSKKSNKSVKKGSKRKRKDSAKEAERKELENNGIISITMVKKEVPENEQSEENPEEMAVVIREDKKKTENETVNEAAGEEVVVKKKRIGKSKSEASKKLKTKIKSKLKAKSEEYKEKKRPKQEKIFDSFAWPLLPHSKKFSMLAGDNF